LALIEAHCGASPEPGDKKEIASYI